MIKVTASLISRVMYLLSTLRAFHIVVTALIAHVPVGSLLDYKYRFPVDSKLITAVFTDKLPDAQVKLGFCRFLVPLRQ